MKIIFVRHGLTMANIEKKYSTPETKLEESGLYILDKTKEHLKNYEIDEVYTSGLIRSQETAKILGFDKYLVDERLNEMDFGDFKGKSIFEVREDYKNFFEQEKESYFDLPSLLEKYREKFPHKLDDIQARALELGLDAIYRSKDD